MSNPQPTITVNIDPTNPGQFFACCGLMVLADRLWLGAEGWFDEERFCMSADGSLEELVRAITVAELKLARADNIYSSPLIVGKPFRPLTIDWWETDRTGAKDLKVWAGTMESHGIAYAMQQAMKGDEFLTPNLFNVGMVVQSPTDPGKKKEPFYFDARRAPNAHSRDVGFSANDLSLTTVASPAVELLCLIGLQVARPRRPNDEPRIYDYFTWPVALPTSLLLVAASGFLEIPGHRGYRFENWFRTGQRKHKAFRPAVPINLGV